jgi:hypothetical protein
MRVTLAPGIWMRRLRWTLGWGGFFIANAALYWWFAVDIVFFYHWKVHSSTANTVGSAVMLFGIAAAFTMLGVRAIRSGLWISAERVVVRGALTTHSCAPDDVVEFVAGTRVAPCPLLHRTHGRPLDVSALSRGGGLRSRYPMYLRQLEPVCAELNALLRSVQSAGAANAHEQTAAVRRDHAIENYHLLRTIVLSFTGLFWALSGAVVALEPKTTVAVAMAIFAAVNGVSTYLILRGAKRGIDHHATTPGPPSDVA